MVLTALAATDYPLPERVWLEEEPPVMLVLTTLTVGVAVHGHPAKLKPLVNRPDWHLQARCFSAGADVFFGDEINDGRPIMRPKILARARAICHGCPVARTCLTWALEQDERYGVWAGTTGRNRDAMQMQLRAGSTVTELVDSWLATL